MVNPNTLLMALLNARNVTGGAGSEAMPMTSNSPLPTGRVDLASLEGTIFPDGQPFPALPRTREEDLQKRIDYAHGRYGVDDEHYAALPWEAQAQVNTTIGGNWPGNFALDPRLEARVNRRANNTRQMLRNPTGMRADRFAGMPPIQQPNVAQPTTEKDIAESVMNIVRQGSSVPGVDLADISNQQGIRGYYSDEAKARLAGPDLNNNGIGDREEKRIAHHEKMKAMQPQYAPMQDRQAAVHANAAQRGMARDARMMGGWGPAIGTRMLAQAEAGQGGVGDAGMGAALSPLLAGVMFGPQAFDSVMQGMGSAQEMAARMQMANEQMQLQERMQQMQGDQRIAQIQAENQGRRDLMTDPAIIANRNREAGVTPTPEEMLAAGDPVGALSGIANANIRDYEAYVRQAAARFPELPRETIDRAWTANTGKEAKGQIGFFDALGGGDLKPNGSHILMPVDGPFF